MLLKNVHWKLVGQNCLLFVHYEFISQKVFYRRRKKTSKCYVGVFFVYVLRSTHPIWKNLINLIKSFSHISLVIVNSNLSKRTLI